jgi:hypothetical protein
MYCMDFAFFLLFGWGKNQLRNEAYAISGQFFAHEKSSNCGSILCQKSLLEPFFRFFHETPGYYTTFIFFSRYFKIHVAKGKLSLRYEISVSPLRLFK